MNSKNPQEVLYNHLQELNQTVSELGLPFYEEFKRKWDSILYSNICDPITSTYRHGDDGQVYTKRIHTEHGLDFELQFDITHMRITYEDQKKAGLFNHFENSLLCVSKNKCLLYKGSRCLYTYYPKEERKESYNNDGIFFTMIPLVQKGLIIIDGSHRVSALVDSMNAEIPALFIDPAAIPVYLISSNEMAIYMYLYDIHCIHNARLVNQLGNIKSRLSVFDENSALQFLIEENRIHGNIST